MATASFEREIIIDDPNAIDIIVKDLNDTDTTPNFIQSQLTINAEAAGDDLLANLH